MAFGDDDLRAMESDFGVPVTFAGLTVGPCLFGQRVVMAQDANGYGVERAAMVLRVRAGVLGAWSRDDVITIDGRRWKLREKVDDPSTVDAAWDLIAVGAL